MRSLHLVLAASMFIMLLPVGSAQDGAFMEDDLGDHKIAIGGAEQNNDDWPMLDLVSADLIETEDDFTFVIQVAELDPRETEVSLGFGGGGFGTVEYDYYFTYGEQRYRVQMLRFVRTDDVFIWAELEKWEDGREGFDDIRRPEAVWDLAADTIAVTIERDDITDQNGAPPQKNRELADMYVTSMVRGNVGFWFVPGTEVMTGGDRMPNEGNIGLTYVIEEGIDQSGHARLWSEKPVRVSNGEATTFLYTVIATNEADRTDTFVLKAEKPPANWVVTFPEGRLRLDAGESLQVPVLLTVPFQHQHGVYIPVMVEMVSQSDPLAVGRIELGVRYTEVPQPAGHHSQLFIHSGETESFGPFVGTEGYFNTVEDYEFDTGTPIHPGRTFCGVTEVQHRWYMDLKPGLQMGLDFDLERKGTLEFAVQTQLPAPGARVSGQLHRYETNEQSRMGWGGQQEQQQETMVAELPEVTLGDLGQGQTANVQLDIVPTAYGDYLPDTEESRLVLRLDFVFTSPGAGTPFFGCGRPGEIEPTIQPGGWMELPLNEFHDDVDDYFSALSGIELFTLGKQQRMVNPGKTVVFNITAENIGTQGGKYSFELTGRNPEWGRVLGATEVSLKAGQSKNIILAVTAPNAAADGELADITLHASKVDDPNIRSLIRVLVEVDTDDDHPDESVLAGELEAGMKTKKSPGPAVALLGLALLALVRRRS